MRSKAKGPENPWNRPKLGFWSRGSFELTISAQRNRERRRQRKTERRGTGISSNQTPSDLSLLPPLPSPPLFPSFLFDVVFFHFALTVPSPPPMEGDFTHLTHGFSHAPSLYSASNLDDDTTSIASSRLTRDGDTQTVNDDDAFSEVNGDDTASVVGLATARRHGTGVGLGGGSTGDAEDEGETMADGLDDVKLPDWACAYVPLYSLSLNAFLPLLSSFFQIS